MNVILILITAVGVGVAVSTTAAASRYRRERDTAVEKRNEADAAAKLAAVALNHSEDRVGELEYDRETLATALAMERMVSDQLAQQHEEPIAARGAAEQSLTSGSPV